MQVPEPSSGQRKRELVLQALKRHTPQERAAFLDGACGDDAALRTEIEALLAMEEGKLHPTDTSPGAEVENNIPQDVGSGSTLGLASAQPSEGAGSVIGRYKILERIGEGGFGVVYVAEQREPVKRRVALKVIKLGMDTRQVVARFEAERQALALMDHPNIAKVLDAGATETGRPFFVMELVKGIPITKYCDQEKLGTRERLDLFIQVCHAIQHAHQKGIIHRDIKPSNILVTLHDGVPVPKVIDFGIAKATQQELTEKTVYTQLQQFIGTPAYMSPEQAEMSGLDIDTRSDIYSLGVLLYELLTGSTPFDTQELLKSGLDEMRKIIRERQPVRPSTRLTQQLRLAADPKIANRKSQIANDLDWIVMKCLEKDRTRRYETANGVAQDIERHLKNEPVVARPPSVGYRLQKSFRRNKLVFTAAGLVGLALVLGVMVSSWQAFRATKAGQRETIARLRADEAAHVAAREKERAEKEAQKAKASELVARQEAYASDMNLACQAQQENNLGLALELLNKHRPAPQEVDLRGWEWRYLWGVCQSDALYTLGQHSDHALGVWGVAISPDDKLLATIAAWDGAVNIWDLDSRRLLETPEANEASVSVAFSPDGKMLAFATRKHGVKLWDVQGHRELTRFPRETGGRYEAPALGFSPNGRQLAISALDGPVVLWDLATYAPGLTLKGHSYASQCLVFTPDGQTLVSGSWDGTIRVWSLTNGQQIAVFTNLTGYASCLAVSRDGKTLASGGADTTVRIWDLAQQRQVAVLTNHTFWVSGVAFLPDEKTLASVSADCSIKLWETGTWREVSTLRGSPDELWGIAFSSDGKTLFTGAKGGKILAWDGRPHPPKARVLRRPDDARGFAVVSHGIPICRHRNNTFSLWNPLTLRELPEHPALDVGSWDRQIQAALSPGGERAAFPTGQGLIFLWDVQRERVIARLPGPSGLSFVEFSPDGKFLAAVAAGTSLRLWSVERFGEVATLTSSGTAPWINPTFAANGEAVAVGNDDGTVDVWDLRRKERGANHWKAHNGTVDGVAFMPDGKRLVTVSEDCTAMLWDLGDLETHRGVRSFGRAQNAFRSVAVSPDGQRIAAGTMGGLIKLWNPTTGQQVGTLKGVNDWMDPNRPRQQDAIYDLAFLPPDGNTLISGTGHEARLWCAPSWEEIEAAEKSTEGKTQ
jgi:WD40 repeat protein/serine/threonine protein kinase